MIRELAAGEQDATLRIINTAAEAYRGHIPEDCWHDPYMSTETFEAELKRGVKFLGYFDDASLVGVMGVERVKNVSLIRHAYVLPQRQGAGYGRLLLDQIVRSCDHQVLVGTWSDATWAIRFYQRNGFVLPKPQTQKRLLNAYWTIPPRMADCSVALAHGNRTDADLNCLIP